MLLKLETIRTRISEIIWLQKDINFLEHPVFETEFSLFDWLVGWLVWFYGISTIVDYLMPNLFLYI